MKKLLFFLLFFVVLVSNPAMADDCDPLEPFCGETDIPLDGGVSALIGVAAAYGLKILRNQQNREK